MHSLIFLGVDDSSLEYLYNARPDIKEQIGVVEEENYFNKHVAKIDSMGLSKLLHEIFSSKDEMDVIYIVVDDSTYDHPSVFDTRYPVDPRRSVNHFMDGFYIGEEGEIHLINFSPKHNVLHRTTWKHNAKNHSTSQLRQST